MKTIIAIVIVITCQITAVQAQIWNNGGKKVTGNNEWVTKTRTTADYEKIKVVGHFDVSLVTGKEGNITIKAESNFMDYIITEVEENTLKIKMKKGYYLKSSPNKSIMITVPFEDISGVILSGSGEIYGTDVIKSNEFKVKISGSGDISLPIEAEKTWVQISGSGDVKLKGNTTHFDIKISGSGDLSAYDLNAKNVVALVSGSGDVEVYASESIKGRVSGSGDISYKGNPKIEDKKIVGSGDITKQ